MANFTTIQRRKVPVWAWRFKDSTATLLDVLRTLQHTSKTTVSEYILRRLHIELHELSFESGATCRSGQAYFMPRTDGSCRITNSGRIAMFGDDEFMTHHSMRIAGIHKHLSLHPYLFTAFKNYAFSLYRRNSLNPGWMAIAKANSKIEAFESAVDHPYFIVNRGMQSANSHQCHRQVWMQSDDQVDDDRPSRAELIVLISWMLGGMNSQRKNTRPCSRKRFSVTHHVFPTMVVSFQPRARVRVLYGYYDGAIKVHFTKSQAFDVPNYERMMDYLLQWAWPILSGRTSTIIPLPTITESDEESQVERTKCLKRIPSSKKHSVKKKLCSFAARMSCPRKKRVLMHTVTHVCELEG